MEYEAIFIQSKWYMYKGQNQAAAAPRMPPFYRINETCSSRETEWLDQCTRTSPLPRLNMSLHYIYPWLGTSFCTI